MPASQYGNQLSSFSLHSVEELTDNSPLNVSLQSGAVIAFVVVGVVACVSSLEAGPIDRL